jgi:hypothetical protein
MLLFSVFFVIRTYVIHVCTKITSPPVHEAFGVTGREVYYLLRKMNRFYVHYFPKYRFSTSCYKFNDVVLHLLKQSNFHWMIA